MSFKREEKLSGNDFQPQGWDPAHLFACGQTGTLGEDILVVLFDFVENAPVKSGCRADRQLTFALEYFHTCPSVVIPAARAVDLEFHELSPIFGRASFGDVGFADSVESQFFTGEIETASARFQRHFRRWYKNLPKQDNEWTGLMEPL